MIFHGHYEDCDDYEEEKQEAFPGSAKLPWLLVQEHSHSTFLAGLHKARAEFFRAFTISKIHQNILKNIKNQCLTIGKNT